RTISDRSGRRLVRTRPPLPRNHAWPLLGTAIGRIFTEHAVPHGYLKGCVDSIAVDVRHERIRRDHSQAAGPVVLDRLEDHVLGVHHEGAVRGNWLPDGAPTEYQDLEARAAGILALGRRDRPVVPRPEPSRMANGDG